MTAEGERPHLLTLKDYDIDTPVKSWQCKELQASHFGHQDLCMAKKKQSSSKQTLILVLVCMDPGLSVDRREKQHADVFRAAYFIQTPGSVSHSLHLFYCPSILNTHTLRHKELFIEPVFLSICRFSQPSPSEIYVKRCVHKLLQYVL